MLLLLLVKIFKYFFFVFFSKPRSVPCGHALIKAFASTSLLRQNPNVVYVGHLLAYNHLKLAKAELVLFVPWQEPVQRTEVQYIPVFLFPALVLYLFLVRRALVLYPDTHNADHNLSFCLYTVHDLCPCLYCYSTYLLDPATNRGGVAMSEHYEASNDVYALDLHSVLENLYLLASTATLMACTALVAVVSQLLLASPPILDNYAEHVDRPFHQSQYQVYLFHASPEVERDLAIVIFDIDLSSHMWDKAGDYAYFEINGHRIEKVKANGPDLSMLTMNLLDIE